VNFVFAFCNLKIYLLSLNISTFILRSVIENSPSPKRPLFDSKIVNVNMHRQLVQVCEFPVETKWQLLYRGSEHGFLGQNFHSRCDKHANTLTVIKSENGNIFGGYTEQLWDSTSGHRADKNAFLFSLVNKDKQPIKMKIKEPSYAIYCHSKFGPTFGHTHCDLIIKDNSNVRACNSSVDFGQTYPHPTYAHGSNEAKSFLAGSAKFQVAEIEVFRRQ
jgi:hypothetical protein